MARRLPPATLNETARLEQRANLLRSVSTKNSNRPSEDRIHHTESAVGERRRFPRARRNTRARAARRSSSRPTASARSAALAGHGSRTRCARAADRTERSDAVRADPPEASPARRRATGRALRDAHGETVRESLRQRHALDPGMRGEPGARERGEAPAYQVRPAPRRRALARISLGRARAGCPRPRSAAARSADPRQKSERGRTPRASDDGPERRDAADRGRRLLPARRRRPRRRKRGFSSHAAPRRRYSSPNLTTSPAPSVRRRSPGRRSRSRLSTTVSFQGYRRRRACPAWRAAAATSSPVTPGMGFSREG